MKDENNFVQPTIPRFDGHYHHWSVFIESFLHSKKHYSLVENEILSTTKKEWNILKYNKNQFQTKS
jgi:hypothetical protein